MQTETLIIGGGLSGLGLAHMLAQEGLDFQLVEARERFGGRILSAPHGDTRYDLGPAWFWPGQPRMDALVHHFELRKFDQFASGSLTFENEKGHVERGRGYPSMAGSYRLEGGFGALVDALTATLPPERLHLSKQITALSQSTDSIVATTANDRFTAKRAVLALPLRLAKQITFSPALPETAQEFMQSTATWMAGQAKVIALYNTPFWRDDGLSGDAMSRRGPMVEIHDASPADGGPYALFGFIGIAAQARSDAPALKKAITDQFVRLFGPKAAKPNAMILKDWAFDPLTSTAADTQPVYAQPTYGLSSAMHGLMDGRLIFAGTEAAAQFGGYLEGALEAAENARELIGQEST